MNLTKGQIMMIHNMVNCELSNKNTVYSITELVNLKEQCDINVYVSESLFTQEQFDYVMNVPEIYLRSHLLHQVRLRDNMEADRNSFEKMYNELLSKYNAR